MNVPAALRRYFRAWEQYKKASAGAFGRDAPKPRGITSELADEIEAYTGEGIGDLMTRAKLWPIKFDRHRVRWNDEQRHALAESEASDPS